MGARRTAAIGTAISLVLSSLLILGTAPPAAAADPVGTVDVFSSPAQDPRGIVGTVDGSIWWTNFADDSVTRMTSDGDIDVFRHPQIRGPIGITEGPDGAVWVAAFNSNGGIGRIAADGTYTTFSGALQARAITTGPDGNLWHTRPNSVIRLTPAGVRTEFTDPRIRSVQDIVAGPDGNVWFTNGGFWQVDITPPYTDPPRWVDTSIGRITPDGTLTFFTGATALPGPDQLALGPDGNLWFTTDPGTIYRVDPATGTITPVTSVPGAADITAGPDGNLWIAASSNIVRLTTAGATTSYFALAFTNAIAAGADGNLYATDSASGGAIWRITTTGAVTKLPLPTVQAPTVVRGSDGNLWYTNTTSIGRLTPDGDLDQFGATWTSLNRNMTAGPDGNLWFTTEFGFGRSTTDGVLTQFPWPRGFVQVVAMVGAPDGNVWFADNYSGATIGRITPDGTRTLFQPAIGSPRAMVVGPDGNLWILSSTAAWTGTISKLSLTGQLLGSWPVDLGGTDLVVGPDGNIWFPSVDAVGRITPTGTVTEFPTPGGPSVDDLVVGPDSAIWFSTDGIGSTLGKVTMTGAVTDLSDSLLWEPLGMGPGPDGNMWFSETRFGRVHRVSPTGEVATFPAAGTVAGSNWLPTDDGQGLWFSGGDGIGRVQTLPEDVVSFTTRFSGPHCVAFQQLADAGGHASLTPIIDLGVELFAQLAEAGQASDLPSPNDGGPCPVTVTFPATELARLEATAEAWGLTVDELVHDGGQIILAIIWYLAVNGFG